MPETPPRGSGSPKPLFSSNEDRARYWQVEGTQAAMAGYPGDAGEAYGHYLYYQHLAKAARKNRGRSRKAALKTGTAALAADSEKEQAHFDAIKQAYEEQLEAVRRERAEKQAFGRRREFP